MAFTVIASGGAQSTDSLSVTTPPINCLGADLIIVITASTFGANIKITDSEGNSYPGSDTEYGATPGNGVLDLYAVFLPAVSASMTFTVSRLTNTAFPAIAVLAVSGGSSRFFDQQAGADSRHVTQSSVTAGPITPSQDNELWVSAVCLNTASSGVPANGEGTLIYAAAIVGSTAWGLGMAYGIQTTATPQSCGWSWSANSVAQYFIVSFIGADVPPPAVVFGGGGGFSPGACQSAGFGGGDDR